MATTTATIDISVARNEFHRLDQRLADTQVLYVTRHHQPAFSVEQRGNMIKELREIKVLLQEQNALLRGDETKGKPNVTNQRK